MKKRQPVSSNLYGKFQDVRRTRRSIKKIKRNSHPHILAARFSTCSAAVRHYPSRIQRIFPDGILVALSDRSRNDRTFLGADLTRCFQRVRHRRKRTRGDLNRRDQTERHARPLTVHSRDRNSSEFFGAREYVSPKAG